MERYGVDGVHPRRLRAHSGPAPQLPPHVERRLLAVAIAEATWGCARLAAYAQRLWRLRVAPNTVQRLLRRHGLARRRQRLLVLEHHSAARAGLLAERTRQALWRLRHGRTRHVEAAQPAELFCLDTFYIGKLKGVGKVWQITACDAASSYGVARILPALSHTAVSRFLRHVLLPLVRRAGWTLQRVLTDGGGEFKASFDDTCPELGIRHTRIQPRHAWTNGFVERLQQTILTEHWRVVFRRHYLLLVVFVTWQMSLHSRGARISNACQTLMTRWLTTAPTTNDLEEATRPGEMAGVGLPNALWREMDARRVRWQNQSWWRWVLAMRFEIAVYGLILLATVAVAVRVWSVRAVMGCD